MKYSIFTALVSATILSACSMIPDYAQPASPVSQAWPQGEAYNENQIGHASQIAWRSFFRSQNLQNIITTALENNRDLRVAALNIEVARAQYRIQRADLLPSLATGGSLIRQGIPENASVTRASSVTSTYSADIGVTAFELDLFGRLRSLNQAALEEYFATEEAEKTTRISLIAEVANAYLTLLADKKLLKLTEETLSAQQESFSLISRSYELGIGTQLDVAQAQQSVETARANKALYIRQVAQDRNALSLLAGTNLDAAILETETLDDVAIMQDLPVGLPSEVLLSRPDVMQAEYLLKSANANIGAARANFFPSINLTGSVGLASTQLSDLFASGSGLAWQFVPQVTLPIFEGGRNFAIFETSKINRDIAVAQYEKSIQVAFREVADELAARGTYTDQLEAQRELVSAARKSYELSDARYKQGIDSHLNVLDAQRSLYAAQQNEIVVQRERLANLVTLYKALGGGVN